MTRAVTYGRLSARAEDDVRDSVPQQLEGGRACIERMGWELVGEYVDESVSAWDGGPGGHGRAKDRPGWSSILELARAGEVEVVVARHVDRLLRNPQARSDVRTSGLRVADHSGNVLDDFALGILSEVATKESDIRSDRQLRAEERRLAAGKPPRGGNRHFGFHRGCCPDCRPHAIRDDEAAVLREVAERWLAGEGMRALARELNGRGLRSTRGNEWNHQTLKRTLLSPRLAGVRVHRRGDDVREYRGSWEPIFTADEHARLVRADSSTASRRAPKRYLLTGLLYCGRCGGDRHLNGHMHRPGSPRYACLGCRRNGIAAAPLDEALWSSALGRTWERDRVEERALEGRLAAVEAEARTAEAKLEELDADYWSPTPTLSKDRYTRLALGLRAAVEERGEELRRLRRQRERTGGVWGGRLALAEEYETATPERRRTVLEGAVRRVVLRPNEGRGGGRVNLGRVQVEWADGTVSEGLEAVRPVV